MTQKKSNTQKYRSISTKQPCSAAQYCAELVCIRKRERENKGSLEFKFWNKSQKEEYETKIKNLSSIIDELLILSFGNLQKWMEYGQHINWGGNFIQFVATSSYFNKNFKKYMDLIDTTHPEHIREWPLGGLHPDQKDLYLRMFSELPSVYENISADDFNNSLELKVRE